MGPMMMSWSHCDTARSVQVADTIDLAARKTAYEGVYDLANALPPGEQGTCSLLITLGPTLLGGSLPNALLLPTTNQALHWSSHLLKVVPSGSERRMRFCAPFSCRASSLPRPLCVLLPLCACLSAFSDSSTCSHVFAMLTT